MRSEEELKKFLEACRAVSDFGLSKGPCPLLVGEKKDCLEHCDFPEEDRKSCCAEWDLRRGCCAECSFPSAIEWVLGGTGNPTDNGQKILFKTLETLPSGYGTCPDCLWEGDIGCNVERDSELCKLNKKPKDLEK
jgi:hypothetical protein